MRQIRALAGRHLVTTCGYGEAPEYAARHIRLVPVARNAVARVTSLVLLKLGWRDWYYWSHPRIRDAAMKLAGERADLVLANDLTTLPLAFRIAEDMPVLFDAHEFAPLEYEDRWVWRFFIAPYNNALCRLYLSRIAGGSTVCQGIANRYERDYSVRLEVVTNAAPWQARAPRRTDGSVIRLIHHGAAIESRRIEVMIEMFELLDSRFTLDLLLVPGDSHYIAWLRRMAVGEPRIRFLDRVPMERLIALSSDYDIGLFLLPPTNFNYAMALPNKFFEFIQARLAVAIGPSPEMARIVREFNCGVVAEDFSPASLAHALNQLSSADIDRMKAGSDRAARAYTAETNAEKLREIVASVLKES
jgi:glycosyltransferase involved in cell wall biosynthesis